MDCWWILPTTTWQTNTLTHKLIVKKLIKKNHSFSLSHMWPYLILVVLFRPFGFIAHKDFQIWHSNLSTLAYLMKVDPEICHAH
jgi:hypothetical protein